MDSTQCVNSTDSFDYSYIRGLSYPDLYFLEIKPGSYYCSLIDNLYFWIYQTYHVYGENEKPYETNPRNPYTNEPLSVSEIRKIVEQYKVFKSLNRKTKLYFTQEEYDDFVIHYEEDPVGYMEIMDMLFDGDRTNDEYKKVLEMEKYYREMNE